MQRDEPLRLRWRAFISNRKPPGYMRGIFATLDRAEMSFVRRQVASTSRPAVAALASTMNALGNGWLYPPLAAGVLVVFGRHAFVPLLVATCSVVLAHSIYPFIKLYLARPRPMDRDPTLRSICPPLDLYSCPSGHAMTAAAAFIPLAQGYPLFGAGLILAWLMLGWARIAAAHHYPSDLIAGAAIGILTESANASFWHRVMT
jgi:undecaprenyl-diphosphatase